MVEVGNVQSDRWLNRRWSNWIALEAILQHGYGPQHQSGVYRIRDARSSDSLLYIGESKDVRARLFQLRNAMEKVANGGKQGPPHWAGASILHHQRQGAKIDVSWLLDSIDDEGERKGIECECVAAHRWLLNINPACQFIALARRKNT